MTTRDSIPRSDEELDAFLKQLDDRDTLSEDEYFDKYTPADEVLGIDTRDTFCKFIARRRGKELTETERRDIVLAALMFAVFEHIYYYGGTREEYFLTPKEEVIDRIAAYNRWREYFEALYPYNIQFAVPVADLGPFGPLAKDFVRNSQIFWHWYGLEQAAPLLEASAHFWIEYVQTSRKTDEVPWFRLKDSDYKSADVERKIWSEPEHCFYLNYYWLGQIYVKQGRRQDAVRAFETFLRYEPEFVYRNDVELHPHSYLYKNAIPDSLSALRNIAALFGELGDATKSAEFARRADALETNSTDRPL
jgi:hypothetical protein